MRVLLLLLVALLPTTTYGFGRKPVDPTPPPAAPPVKPVPPPALPVGDIPLPTPGSGFLSCNSRIGGSWNFGMSPSACSVSPAQSPSYAAAQYAPVVFHDGADAQKAYVSSLYAFAREIGTYYIKRRNPSVSAAEIDGFLQGFFTLMNQESFWTHYRLGTDGILRYMRGDSLHGFGLMQVDDRSHSVALNQGKGVDLADNILYGLDVYYAAWVRSAKANCVSSASNYEARARASWSAYNGGPGALCRFANTTSKDADKDAAYASKYRARAWLGFVADTRAGTHLDVVCLAEGKRPCAFKP